MEKRSLIPCDKCLVFPICRTKYHNHNAALSVKHVYQLHHLVYECQHLKNYIFFITGINEKDFEKDFEIKRMYGSTSGYGFALYNLILNNIGLLQPVIDIFERNHE